MSLRIEHYIIWLEVSEDDVPFVEVFHGEDDFGEVELGPVFGEAPVFVEGPAHVASVGVVEEEEELLWGLEGVFEAHDEGVLGVGEDIPFGLGVPDQVLAHDLLLVEDLHGVLLVGLFEGPVGVDDDLLHQEHLPKAPLPQLHQRNEVRRPYPLLIHQRLLHLPLELVVVLPDLDEPLLPFFVLHLRDVFGLPLLLLLLLGHLRLLLCLPLLLDQPVDQSLLALVLVLQELIHIVVLVHKLLDAVHAVVMHQHFLESFPAIGAFLFLELVEALPPVRDAQQVLEELGDLDVLGRIHGNVPKLVGDERIYASFLH
mmetsp:Transcript_3187/g.3088  ORF Transcript_3187/g.3088 Transcript_3187/m.3088 type:complete len:314 (-) Transcript_3187:962-1903(-)